MSQATRILIGLILGLAAGVAAVALAPERAAAWAGYVKPVGTAWLNALRMTIVPLVVALLVTGIAATAKAARASRLAARAILFFVAMLWLSAVLGGLLTPLALDWFPLAGGAAGALRETFSSAAPGAKVPGFGDFVTGMIPTNPISAAAEDRFLPLIVFTTLFGFAATRLEADQRERLTGFFQALADTMLVMIRWVLLLGPIGVAALAFVVGTRAGSSAFGALIHYILIVAGVGLAVSLIAYPVAAVMGRTGFYRFARAVAPAQAVAVSTQSSIASLPEMLRSSAALGRDAQTTGVVLPLAVAIFRFTSPAMNVAVAIYVAHVFGIELTAGRLAAGIAVGAITTMGSVGLPGQVSFVSSIAPIAVAMGVPVEPLALLVAVETMPDLVRTIGNVTMDVAVTSAIVPEAEVADD